MDNESIQMVTDALGSVRINEIIPRKISSLRLSTMLDGLTAEEYKSIFFLLMDHVDEDLYPTITKQDESSMKEKLDQVFKAINDDYILIEVLGTMKKYMKLRKLGTCHHVYEKLKQRKFSNIDGIVKMFYMLCEDLTDRDLEDLKRILPYAKDQIETAEDWFYWALRYKFISKDDFSKLEKIFQFFPNRLEIIRNCVKPSLYHIRSPSAHIHCGIAVILNYECFGEKFEKRKGSTIDVDALKDVWKKFGFKTDVYNDLTCSETILKLQNYAALDHSNYDVFVCCVLSHGLSNTVFSSDGEEIQIPFLISLITDNCSSLNSKPKLFFIQACQGTSIPQGFGEPVFECESSDNMPPAKVANSSIHPIAADVLLAISSINGFVSFRSHNRGSWFIDAFCKVMIQKGDKLSMLDVIVEVNNLVRKNSADFGPGGPRNAQQIVNCINTFEKALILKKKYG